MYHRNDFNTPQIILEIVSQNNDSFKEEKYEKNKLYNWLKFKVLVEEPKDVVMSTFEAIHVFGFESPQDLFAANLTADHFRDDIKIPFSLCVRIVRALREYPFD